MTIFFSYSLLRLNSIGRKEECLPSKKITRSIELWQYKGNLLLCISLCEKKDFLKIDVRLSEVTEVNSVTKRPKSKRVSTELENMRW